MARILDTIPDFEKYARKAGLESPFQRETLWKEMYEQAHPEVFRVFYEGPGSPEGMHAVVRELSKVRLRVKKAAPEMPALIDQVEPAVKKALGLDISEQPLHVLMVGTFSTNGFVAKLGDDNAVFHCLEWFSDLEPTRVLAAHEVTHCWHQMANDLGEHLPTDLAWTAFYEGLAIQASRLTVPDRPEEDYFWYGIAGFEDWLEECRKKQDKLLKEFSKAVRSKKSADKANDSFFGSGFVEELWRSGFFLADYLVSKLGRTLPELAAMSVDEGRQQIIGALD